MFPKGWSNDERQTTLWAPETTEGSKDLISFDAIANSDVVPLKDLKHWPRAIVCPACRESSITRVERKICMGTHVMAGLFFLCSIVGGPIPYFAKGFKNVEHYCCRCNRRLVTFHFGTGTELHVF